MAVENLQTDFAKANQSIYPYTANSVHVVKGVLEMTAAASATSTYDFGLIPADAILLWSASGFSSDDLASSGSPTIDIGLFEDNDNLTSLGYSDDDNAIKDGIDVATAANSNIRLLGDIANIDKPVWQLISGVSTSNRVRGSLRVKATLKDADCNTGGTIALELAYFVK